ncbi:FeoB-associated Cys-rich membrane protein [Gemmatimonas sp.]|jgi:hypothetical protein|nr:FeoB-associated Cys-rich membrane protein [Gemmatimonas sp.]MCA2982415.1 FeoB-associated Cys-rich membrane protein [Gemmatimonas sp.]MCA2988057.1 FeoB-associated Cys-rich membrane protein [Gemmatimonas sp.]MCA2989483.1 FeoB-associated Cys-rich membrane protein [Gemmatimonas sp.]MCA2995473.1 FeoB-associated Cys-rich membrane protein [Gemmatimonas sp.]MCE2952945.1 FeoB-associated Cys-rich membrane protein [Gemmatimonas sp.]
MTTESVVVWLIVAGALGYVGRMVWRATAAARQPKNGCGSDCGCGH